MKQDEKGSRVLTMPDDAGGRLDSNLSRLLPDVSRRRIKAAFREGRVLVDGRSLRGSDSAKPGANVELLGFPELGHGAEPPHSLDASTECDLIEQVFADDSLVVVEKPAGKAAYPLCPGEGGSVAEAVLELFPDMAEVGDQPHAPGLCHRLDIETSGLLLFARSPEAFEHIRAQFREKRVKKLYLATAAGALFDEGTIDVPIGRRSSKRMLAGPPPEMRQWPARTRWRAIRRGGSSTLVELTLETGVTHQARVHLASLGHPILGDEKYGGPDAERLGLHASKLGLEHPASGKWIDLSSRHDETVVGMVT